MATLYAGRLLPPPYAGEGGDRRSLGWGLLHRSNAALVYL